MKQEDVNIEVVSIDDLVQDDHNFNKGNEQGAQLLERSFRECGAGRSVLIAGSGVSQRAKENEHELHEWHEFISPALSVELIGLFICRPSRKRSDD